MTVIQKLLAKHGTDQAGLDKVLAEMVELTSNRPYEFKYSFNGTDGSMVELQFDYVFTAGQDQGQGQGQDQAQGMTLSVPRWYKAEDPQQGVDLIRQLQITPVSQMLKEIIAYELTYYDSD